MSRIHLHYTPAVIVAIVGAAIAVAVSFGLHISPAARDSILTLVGLIAGGIVIGGGVKSAGMLSAGVHPIQTKHHNPAAVRHGKPVA